MRKAIFSSLFVVLFVVAAGLFFVFYKIGNDIDSSDYVNIHKDNTNQKMDVRNIDVGSNLQRSMLPAGYSKINVSENSGIENSESGKVYMHRFNEIIMKIDNGTANELDWVDLGSIKRSFGDYKGAEAAWLYSIKINQFTAVAFSNLGNLYWHELQDYPKAEEMFLKFADIHPDRVFVYRNLSDLYRFQYKKKADQADDILLKGLVENPNNPDLLSALAVYYEWAGDIKKAIYYADQLVGVNHTETTEKYLNELKNKLKAVQ